MIRGYRASGGNVRLKSSTDKSQLLNCAASSILILRIAALAIAGSLAVAVPAHAEGFWSDYNDYRYYQPERLPPPPLQRTYHHPAKKQIKPTKEAAKPQGPLIIAISINRQHLKIYDANGLFAETPVSTGMRGHTTPMGVFSIIQKTEIPRVEHLQRRADAVHGADHMVRHRHACRRTAGLSGFARLHPDADGLRREDVRLGPGWARASSSRPTRWSPRAFRIRCLSRRSRHHNLLPQKSPRSTRRTKVTRQTSAASTIPPLLRKQTSN